MKRIADYIAGGNAVLGVEFGSTRIKSVLTDERYNIIASGSHEWENKLENGYWTYSLQDVWKGLQESYSALRSDVLARYGVTVTKLKAIGVSAMMHGYMPFDAEGHQLVPFRTWRNTVTQTASNRLTELFNFNVPQRWSIAHLYQAVLNGEPHVKRINYLTTLAGYVHWQLTGRKVVGMGEASGITPLNADGNDYDPKMTDLFDNLQEIRPMPWKLRQILPQILPAGQNAGYLTEQGARLLDTSGQLASGIPFCPPEGDAQTGMTATNSLRPKCGNVSAGTSVFAMLALDKPLSKYYPEVDVVTTPVGRPVAMVHCNNCTSDLNAWVELFAEFSARAGLKLDKNEAFSILFAEADKGDDDCSDMVSYNFLSGEHVLGLTEGKPLFVRSPVCNFNLANFVKNHLYSAFCVLKYGLEILRKGENVQIEQLVAQGGMFKVKNTAQQILANALNCGITVCDTASEGGAWGISLLAAYMTDGNGASLEEFIDSKVFAGKQGNCLQPVQKGVVGFEKYYARFLQCLKLEQEAIGRLH